MDNLDLQPEDLHGYGDEGGDYPSPKERDLNPIWKGNGVEYEIG